MTAWSPHTVRALESHTGSKHTLERVSDMTHALEYVRNIESELDALEQLSTLRLDDLDSLESLPGAPVREMARDLLDAGGLEPESLDELAAVSVWLEAYALEVTVQGTRTLGQSEWTPQRVSILRTFGGPNARVHAVEGSDYLEVEVQWGSDAARGSVHAPEVSMLLWELSEL